MYTNRDRVCPVCLKVVGRDYIVDLKRALVYHIACIPPKPDEVQREAPTVH